MSDPVPSSYGYDLEGHLTSLVQGDTFPLRNSFDGDGVRVVGGAGGSTVFVGDWYEVRTDTQTPTVYSPFTGQPVAMKTGSTLSYLHHDHLGSLVAASDASGTELGWARSWPFGQVCGA